MCRLIETICVKDGKILHLKDHQARMDRSMLHFHNIRQTPQLESLLMVPEEARKGWYKCRILYGREINEIVWESYKIKKASSLSLVYADNIDYEWKYADRSVFKHLIEESGTDDIVIVKNGYITDSSYANLLFRSGKEWFTPTTPLLEGTQRKRLLESGSIKEKFIRVEDLIQYDRIKYINAMLDMVSGPEWSLNVIENL